MDLNVKITLSDRLFQLLEDKLPTIGHRVEKSEQKQLRAETSKEISVSVTASPSAAEEAPVTVEVAPTPTPAEPAKPAKPAETPAPAEAEDGIPTDPKKRAEYIRQIMHRARQRIEGENYKTNTTGELYLKYHKPMADTFIQLAMQYGASKPSAIEDPEKIKAFEAECEQIHLDEDGNIATGPAPF